MNDYPAGTVAIASVDGETQRIFRTGANEWCDSGGFGQQDENVTGVRPLVVLDLYSPHLSGSPDVRRVNLLEHLRKGTSIASHLADQIEAQTNPPRIPEPGLWGVVEAAANGSGERGQFVRTPKFWYCAQLDQARGWDALTDPTLIREGVES